MDKAPWTGHAYDFTIEYIGETEEYKQTFVTNSSIDLTIIKNSASEYSVRSS
jgi:hypothetical protein